MWMMTRAKEEVEEKKAELLKLTMDFSKKFLNEEYENIIEKLINKMARKREVPFMSGRIEIWAAAIIHALGTINFLFDKSTKPYMSVTDINNYFGTKQSTTTQKSKKIRDMFNMTYFDSNFSIDSVVQSSPFNDLTVVNGLLIPQHRLNDRHVDIDAWEIQIAKILGISGLERGEKYKESDLYKLLKVQKESLMSFYEHLLQWIKFPFTALFVEEVGPLEIVEFEVNCLRLDSEVKVDDSYGILVESRIGHKKVILPLASIFLDEEDMNYKWIHLYYEWFWSYR